MIKRITSKDDPDLQSKLIPSGLIFITDFISTEEEAHILASIPPTPDRGLKSRNSTRRYGSLFPYKGGVMKEPTPDYLEDLNRKIMSSGLSDHLYKSVSLNEYLPGNSNALHVDNLESGPTITIISLGVDTPMLFQNHKYMYELMLPARSLIQMKDDIRYRWRHSIPPVKEKRYSIVFRC